MKPFLLRSWRALAVAFTVSSLPAGDLRAAPVAEVFASAQRAKPALLATLAEIVAIESGSRDLEGLDRLAAVIADRLKQGGGNVEVLPLGPEIYKMQDTPDAVGNVVRATFTGSGTKKILLIAHMDTVYPRGSIAKQPFRIEDNRAYGLGISDDKQGVAVILHVLGMLKELGFRDYGTLTVLINGDEELSSPGSRTLLTQMGAEHDVVLSFESSRAESDKLALATSGIASVNLTVKGRGSHSGAAPEKGVNALDELSHQILQMRDLSEPELGLKMNWTQSHAGIAHNVIPPEAFAHADVRVLRVADYERIEKKVQEKIKNKLLPQSSVVVDFERRRPPLEPTAVSRVLGAHAQKIYREIDLDLMIDDRPEGGGTDAAFAALQAKGAVIERLGLRGYGAHSSENEYVLIDSIEPRLYLAARLIQDLAQDKITR